MISYKLGSYFAKLARVDRYSEFDLRLDLIRSVGFRSDGPGWIGRKRAALAPMDGGARRRAAAPLPAYHILAIPARFWLGFGLGANMRDVANSTIGSRRRFGGRRGGRDGERRR